MGGPDGSCVDAEGYLWSAQYRLARIVRYAPDGRVDRTIALPTGNPTCCAFGGDQLDTLYITTSSFRMSPERRAAEPLAGNLFAVVPGVRGCRSRHRRLKAPSSRTPSRGRRASRPRPFSFGHKSATFGAGSRGRRPCSRGLALRPPFLMSSTSASRILMSFSPKCICTGLGLLVGMRRPRHIRRPLHEIVALGRGKECDRTAEAEADNGDRALLLQRSDRSIDVEHELGPVDFRDVLAGLGDFGIRIAGFEIRHDAIEDRRRERDIARFREPVEPSEYGFDAENLDATAALGAPSIGAIGASSKPSAP
jgi:hypothetical protein